MRDTFVRTLVELAKKDKNIELITGDLGFGVLKPFWEQCPDQFTNAGIAEQNMTTVAAGMALEGKTVFTYSIGNFPTLRCLEQIRNDCAYHKANVKVVCIGGGFVYGSLGMSHQATEDLAVLRALPDVVVMAPADLVEAEECTKALAICPGTAYLRLGRGGEKRIHDKIENFQIGKAIKVNDGEKIAIFSTGAIFEEVKAARANFTDDEWIDVVLRSVGMEPSQFDRRVKWLHLARLIPLVENNYNLTVSTYVTPEDTREKIDIAVLNQEIQEIVKREEQLRFEIDKIISEIEV